MCKSFPYVVNQRGRELYYPSTSLNLTILIHNISHWWMMAINIPDLTIFVHFTYQSSILDNVSKNKKNTANNFSLSWILNGQSYKGKTNLEPNYFDLSLYFWGEMFVFKLCLATFCLLVNVSCKKTLSGSRFISKSSSR